MARVVQVVAGMTRRNYQHPITALLDWEGPMPPAIRRLRSVAMEEVRFALDRAETRVRAAERLGANYRSLARWLQAHRDLFAKQV